MGKSVKTGPSGYEQMLEQIAEERRIALGDIGNLCEGIKAILHYVIMDDPELTGVMLVLDESFKAIDKLVEENF